MEKIKTSVLVIGSGGAGLRCAIELSLNGISDVLVVGESKFDNAHTVMAQGGINAALGTIDKEDSPDVHFSDTFSEGQFISNPNLVQILVNNSPKEIEKLLEWGANFHKESDGRLTQRFFGAHTYRRTIFSGDETGKEIIRVLVNKAKELNIKYQENTYISKIVTENNKVLGCVGIHEDKILFFESPTVVIATGGFSNLYERSSSRVGENYGEGIMLAYDARARIGDMEMVQFHPTGLLFPPDRKGDLVSEAVRGEGGILLNKDGERFMKKYSPEKMELSTRDVVARAIYNEIVEKRGGPKGGVFLDITKLDSNYIKERLPGIYNVLLSTTGIDISKEAFEVAPTAHYTMGGIYFDDKTGKTTVEGLYAVGESTMGVHGANRLGGNSLAETLVFGQYVGSLISNNSKHTEKITDSRINNLQEEILTSLANGTVQTIKTITLVQRQMWLNNGIVREEKKLNIAKTFLEKTSALIDKIGSSSVESKYETVVNKTRLKSVLTLGKLTTLAALKREESRGAHFRNDFQKTSKDWLKNIFFEKSDSSDRIVMEPVTKPSKEMLKVIEKFSPTSNYAHLE